MVFALIPPMADNDGGAFFGFLGVAFALVAASGFSIFPLKNLKKMLFFKILEQPMAQPKVGLESA